MRRVMVRTGTLVGVLILVGLAGPAQAQSLDGRLEVGLKGAFGFEGDTDLQFRSPVNTDYDFDLDPTVGFAVYATWEVLRYLDVGGMFACGFWRTETMDKAGVDRNTILDIDLLVKGKIPFLDGALHLYLAFPIGLSINVPAADIDKIYNQVDTGVGVNLSLLAGASWVFWKGFGAFLELGYMFHYANQDISALGIIEVDVDGYSHEMAFNFGLFYRL